MISLQSDSFGWVDGADGLRLTVRTPEAKRAAELLQDGKLHTVEIKDAKRSLTANAYYHVLKAKLAEALKVSKPFIHNMMLRRYGQLAFYGGENLIVMLPDTDAAARQADEDEKTHLKPTSHTKSGKGGTYRAYLLLRGSSTYDVIEFSRLLDGLISECKEVGIETMTPAELARLEGYDGKAH